MTTLQDDIANGRIDSIREALSAQPQLANCAFEHREEENERFDTTCFQSPLNFAARKGQIEALKVLLECGADYDYLSSCRYKRYGASTISQLDGPPLYWTCRANRKTFEIAKALLEAGADIYMPCVRRERHETTSYHVYTVVWGASNPDGLRVKRMLLFYGYNPNSTINGYSLLHHAIDSGNIDEMKMLVASGATVKNRKNNPSPMVTALHVCKENVSDFTKMCDILLCAGADINMQAWDGTTVLHQSIEYMESYRVLVKFGADELMAKTLGGTSLQMCCRDYMLHSKIPLMVEATANQAVFHVRTRRGWYPFQLAALCSHSYPYEKITLTASFSLLRADPSVLSAACMTKKQRFLNFCLGGY